MNQTSTIAVLLFEGVNALDVAGPIEAFNSARAEGNQVYTVETYSFSGLTVRTESSLTLLADHELDDSLMPEADLLLIPGGAGIREPQMLGRISRWLAAAHVGFSRIAAVCTGAYAVADSGLADGREIATHWQFADDLQRQYPNIKVNEDALFVRDGKVYSSGGITAGIDLALDIVETDYGPKTAMQVAREMVVFLRRTGAQAQFSAPLKAQLANHDRLGGVTQWIVNNLSIDLSVAALADYVNLSTRQFSRRFRTEFGVSPARYVKSVRLDSARTLLEQGCLPSMIPAQVGFESEDGFRRAFLDQFGVSPIHYQSRFKASRAQA